MPQTVQTEGYLGATRVQTTGELVLLESSFRIRVGTGDIVLAYDALDSASVDQGALVLAGRDGAALRVTGLADAEATAQVIAELAETVPEVTRGLRGFASVKASAGSDHDVYFAPLVAARREAHAAPDAPRRAQAFAAASVGEALTTAADELAQRRFPLESDVADRRALRAEIDEQLLAVRRELSALELAADAWRGASPSARLRAWRGWCAQLVRVWEAADRGWLTLLPALADSRGTQGAFWRRVLRRGEG
ncbi:MAG: hypothetical protein SFW08_12900 [Gemmatimonadaceae bacterium]|nr:hypothetical protein [Gemmatimonadaceae bacterium]